MIAAKQRGRPTYKRNKITYVFDPDKPEEDVKKIMNQAVEKYIPDLNPTRKGIRVYENSAAGVLYIYNDIYIVFECFRDGWHMKVVNEKGSSIIDMRKEIFGDPNRNIVWTQETEKVDDIIGELYYEIRKYLGDD